MGISTFNLLALQAQKQVTAPPQSKYCTKERQPKTENLPVQVTSWTNRPIVGGQHTQEVSSSDRKKDCFKFNKNDRKSQPVRHRLLKTRTYCADQIHTQEVLANRRKKSFHEPSKDDWKRQPVRHRLQGNWKISASRREETTFTRSNSNEEGGLSASSDCSSNTEMNSANSSSVGMTFTSGSSSDDEGITANCECRGNKENSTCTRRCTQENKIFADSKGTCEKEKISAPSSSEGIKLTNSSCKPVLLMHHDSSTEEINFPIWLKYLKGSSRLVRNMNLNSTRGRTSEEEDIANNKCSSDTESSKSSSDIEMIFASGSSVGMYSSRSSGSEEEEMPVNSKCSS